ncbi:YbjQ family protein [Protaetiibacter sp. SSC-01]|nr:YbjQ family protein [Protaetiibacter sp. SSC-01]
MFVVTTDEIPGYRITRAHGHVLGTIVRTLSLGAGLGAIGSALGGGEGGEITAYSQLLWENRQEAIKRMWADAEQRGANAVVGMRFDSNDLEGVAEVCAFGTAVTVEPI